MAEDREVMIDVTLFDEGPRGIVSRFVVAAISPIVKIAMRFGMSAREFAEIGRWVYVKVFHSTPEFWQHGRATIVQCAIKTGLPRTLCKTMRAVPEPQHVLFTQRQNLAYRVIEGWVSDPNFHDENGKPLPLPVHDRFGPSFARLFHKHGNDVPPLSVLGDLKQVGCVKVEDGVVTLVNQTYGLTFFDEDKLAIAAYMLRRLGETTDHNLTHAELSERRLQRFWWQVFIPVDKAVEARRSAHDAAIEYGRKLDHILEKYAHEYPQEDVHYVELGFVSYLYEDQIEIEDGVMKDELKQRSGIK